MVAGSYLESLEVSGGRVGLYVHVPFCLSRCTYCDFYSVPALRGQLTAEARDYLDGVVAQIHALGCTLGAETVVPTVYIGGGTPSALGPALAEILEAASESLTIDPAAEITVEMNPDDVTPELLNAYIETGVNRFSVGIQSFDDAVLRRFGRRHDASGARAAIRLVRATELPFSLDLIAGVPGVSQQDWAATVGEALSYHPHHISIYSLSVEEHTPLYRAVECGSEHAPDPDEAADQLELASEMLEISGLHRYEISNYARPGYESRHNTSYWTGVPYVGLGPAAASMVNLPDGSRLRFFLHDGIDAFISDPLPSQPGEVEHLSANEAAREDAMLGLRLSAGVPPSLVERAGVGDIVQGLVSRGLLELDEATGNVRPTDAGWLLGNEVFEAVLLG